jgi:hypothetical protein
VFVGNNIKKNASRKKLINPAAGSPWQRPCQPGYLQMHLQFVKT